MRFWDSSTIVPLLFKEPTSNTLNELLREDGEIVVCLDDRLRRAAQAEEFHVLPQPSVAEIEAGEIGEGG